MTPLITLDERALAAAERVYWTDNGVSRHNLAAAILVYLLEVEASGLPRPPRTSNGPETTGVGA